MSRYSSGSFNNFCTSCIRRVVVSGAVASSLLTGCASTRQDSALQDAIAQNDAASANLLETELVTFPIQSDVAQQETAQQKTTQNTPRLNTDASLAPQSRPARLSMARMDLIDAELGNTESLIRDQSFAVKLPNLGIVDFVPSKVVESDEQGRLALRWRDLNGNYIPLFLSEQGVFDKLTAVAFEDIDGDGLGPDVIAIAQYTNATRSEGSDPDGSDSDGSGSGGTQPLSRAIVLFNDGNNQFGIDTATENLLANSSVTTVEAVRALLKEALQGTAAGTVAKPGEGPEQNSEIALALQDLTAGTYARIKANGQFCTGFVCEPSQRQYPLADAQLLSSNTGERIEITLKPDTPISEKDAIAYSQLLSGSANVIFEHPITEKAGNTTLRKTYLPPSPSENNASHAGYSVRLDMTAQGDVSEITFYTVLL